MSKSAPPARLVNALNGEKAPTAFFKALSEAEHFCAELDELHELRTRVAELEGERDNLASDLADLREAHMVTVTALAHARGQRDTFRARIERSGW